MHFKSIKIKNFRNFADLSVDISNKNVFFGMNDIGKTNFLFALRYLFERSVRRRDLIESDFHQYGTGKNIEISVCINIEDNDSSDTQKLRAKLKGAVRSNDKHIYINLVATFNTQLKFAEISIFWGGNEEKLTEMASSNGFYEIDGVFNVIYINSYIDIQELFKKNIKKLIKNDATKEQYDKMAEDEIKKNIDSINLNISNMSGVIGFKEKLTPSYKKMRDEPVSISIRSDFAINSLYANIIPFIHPDGEDKNEYPTSGEGRKKLLAYSVYNLLSDDTSDRMINLFLIEEPETHLHMSMQAALSHFLFDAVANDHKLNYLFVSTHSPHILNDMDDVNLVRIFNENKITSKSDFYSVPSQWKTTKRKLNRSLSEAIFADSVLLVEGESECILFERVLSQMYPFYTSRGICVLSVQGVGFKPYIDILKKLQINFALKTDNDVQKVRNSNPAKYYFCGFERINGLVNHLNGANSQTLLPINKELDSNCTSPQARRDYYDKNRKTLNEIREKYKIHLSHCGFEEDLCECLGDDRFAALLGKKTADDAMNYLQSKKHHHMVELAGNLSTEDCEVIFNHYNFACLKAVLS